MDQRIYELIEEMAALKSKKFKEMQKDWVEHMEIQSPIEIVMLLAISYVLHEETHYSLLTYRIHRQIQIGIYRVDFLIELAHSRRKTSALVVVECDGHEFHEKTKEQAARDKKRDREIQGRGYSILRFSGSEIWKNPLDCAKEVCEFLCKRI